MRVPGTVKWSKVIPEGPGATPRLADRMFLVKLSSSSLLNKLPWRISLKWAGRTSLGRGDRRVSSVPRANSSPFQSLTSRRQLAQHHPMRGPGQSGALGRLAVASSVSF